MALAIHRIIEVSCRLPIDGNEWQVANILSVLQVSPFHIWRKLGRKFFNLRGKLMREIMFAKGNLDFHSRRTVIPKNLDDASDRLSVLARLLDYFDRDNLTGLCQHRLFPRYEDVLADASVLGLYKQDPMIRVKPSDELGYSVLKHLNNNAFPTAATIHSYFPHYDPIAVQHFVHFLCTQKHVATSIVWD